jgi:hypothetical protein
MAPEMMESGVRASSSPETTHEATRAGLADKKASRMSAIIAAAAGRETEVGSKMRLTSVTAT